MAEYPTYNLRVQLFNASLMNHVLHAQILSALATCRSFRMDFRHINCNDKLTIVIESTHAWKRVKRHVRFKKNSFNIS